MSLLLKIHPENPEGRKIKRVVEELRDGAVMIYPTDTVYGLGCYMKRDDAVKKICKIRDVDPRKVNMTFICADISQVSEFTKPIVNDTFRLIKRNVPGPFTFILEASNRLPRILHNKRQTIGVRIPDHPVSNAILEELGEPILSLSLKADDEIIEYLKDPKDMYEEFGKKVDIVIDSGVGNNKPSTIIDCTGAEPVILRQGIAEPRA